MIELFSYSLSYPTLALLFIVAFFIGMTKTGVHGASMFAVPVLAIIFGGKASAGLMLPMLIMADLFAVKYAAAQKRVYWYRCLVLFSH